MKQFILPLRDLVVHPSLTVPVYIDNPVSVACIEAAMNAEKRLVLVPQHSWTYPATTDDVYNVGTIGDIVQVLRMPDGAVHAIIKTTGVVTLSNIEVQSGIFSADVSPVEIADDMDSDTTIALRDKIADCLQTIASGIRKFKMDKLHRQVCSTNKHLMPIIHVLNF